MGSNSTKEQSSQQHSTGSFDFAVAKGADLEKECVVEEKRQQLVESLPTTCFAAAQDDRKVCACLRWKSSLKKKHTLRAKFVVNWASNLLSLKL